MTGYAPFIVFGLPRSRTAWLARFLSYVGAQVHHDLGVNADSLDEFVSILRRSAGTVETGAQTAWRVLRDRIPNLRFFVLRRPIDEVMASFDKLGIPVERTEIEARDQQLEEIASVPGAISLTFDDLRSELCCRILFEGMLGVAWDRARWLEFDRENIQIDWPARIATLRTRANAITALKQEVATADAALLRGTEVEYKIERWASCGVAMEALGRVHFHEIEDGVEPRRPWGLDMAQMTAIDAQGSLLSLTARVAGALVGYCMWTVNTDPESRGLLIANQGPWFVSPHSPKGGVGLGLYRHSIRELRARGVKHIFPHYRLQGRGAELGKYFERLGAKQIQHTYSLWIGDDNG